MSDNTFSIVLYRPESDRPEDQTNPAGRMSQQVYRQRAEHDQVGRTPRTRRKTRGHQKPNHEVIANVDAISAPELVYPEAVYLHDGQTYIVRDLDMEGKVAYVQRRELDYYTQAVLDSRVDITRSLTTDERFPTAQLGFGEVDVAWKTIGFKKIKFETRENVVFGAVDLPAQSLPTTAFWLTPNHAVREQVKQAGGRIGEGLCGLRNLAVVALPLVAMCDSRDISGVVDSKNLGSSSLILYDRYPGGLGYCEKGFDQISTLLEICWQMVQQCDCEDGCPSCVGLPNLRPAIHSDPDLTRGYPIPDKQATIRLLQLLCENRVTDATRGSGPDHAFGTTMTKEK